LLFKPIVFKKVFPGNNGQVSENALLLRGYNYFTKKKYKYCHSSGIIVKIMKRRKLALKVIDLNGE
jgi:hypothetical protein